MQTEQAKTYTQKELNEAVHKGIKQDREFLAQVIRGLPMMSMEAKQGLIENPNGLKVFFSCLGRPKIPETAKGASVPRAVVKVEGFPLKALIDDADNPIEVIKENVAKSWGVDVELFRGETRGIQNVADARMMAMYICRKCGMTSTEIGPAFARDHGTVLYAERTIAAIIGHSARHKARYDRSIELITQCCRKAAA